METTAKKTILRIEAWHGLMLLLLIAAVSASKILDPIAILMGGLFIGINFLFLGYGVAWLLEPLASSGRIKAGIGLLTLKVLVFLMLLSVLFFRFNLDAVSFAVGFSTLLIAIVVETVRMTVKLGT